MWNGVHQSDSLTLFHFTFLSSPVLCRTTHRNSPMRGVGAVSLMPRNNARRILGIFRGTLSISTQKQIRVSLFSRELNSFRLVFGVFGIFINDDVVLCSEGWISQWQVVGGDSGGSWSDDTRNNPSLWLSSIVPVEGLKISCDSHVEPWVIRITFLSLLFELKKKTKKVVSDHHKVDLLTSLPKFS